MSVLVHWIFSFRLLLICALPDYVFHLEKTETGRWRFIDVSEAQERSMGQDASQQVLQQYRGAILPDSDRRVQQVKRVAHRLLKAGGLDSPDAPGIGVLQNYGTSNHPKSSVNWRVFVINAPDESQCISLLVYACFDNAFRERLRPP